jgi:hypothetical protein
VRLPFERDRALWGKAPDADAIRLSTSEDGPHASVRVREAEGTLTEREFEAVKARLLSDEASA